MNDLESKKSNNRIYILKLISVCSVLVTGFIGVAWFLLPIYAPESVVNHSLWADPIVRVFLQEETEYSAANDEYIIKNKSYLKLEQEFKDQMLPLFCDYLKSEDTERADRALNAIEQLIEERTETPGGIIMSMLSGGKAPLDLSEAPELVKNLTNLLDRADKYMKIRIIVVLQSMGTASQDALPTLKKLADTTSDKSIKILSISAIQMIRPGHSMIKDIGDSVEIIKTIAE